MKNHLLGKHFSGKLWALLACPAIILASGEAAAGPVTIASWTNAQLNPGSAVSPINSNGGNTDLNSGTIIRGAGVTYQNVGSTYNNSGWPTVAAAAATDYVDITANTSNASAVHLLFTDQRSANGPVTLIVSYSSTGTGGTFTQVPGTFTVGTTTANRDVNVSAITALDNNANVVFRLQGYSAGNNGGQLILTNISVTGTDSTAPSVSSITRVNTDPTNATTVNWTVTFSEKVTGVAAGNFTFTNVSGSVAGTIGTPTAGATNATWNVPVSSMSGNGVVRLDKTLNTGITDLGTNVLTGGDFNTGEAYTIDSVAPAASLSSAAGDPVSAAISVSVATGESTTNFVSGDITPTNATVSGFSGSGSSYSFTLTPTGEGLFSAVINAGAYTDAAGNGNTVSNTVSRTFDSVGPTIALSSVTADPTNGNIAITVSTSEDTTNFAAGDVSPTNATVANFAGSLSSYSFDLVPSGEGLVSVVVNAATFTDAASNANLISNVISRTFDSIPPSSAASVPDKTRAGTTSLSVDFVASDSGSGVSTTTLYVKPAGAGSFSDSGLTLPGTAGTFVYTAVDGNGRYEFATRATDSANNNDSVPGSAHTFVVLNTATNGAMTHNVVSGNDVLVFPMTDDKDVTITLSGATPGNVSVARTSPLSSPPAYFQQPAQLLNESLTITSAGSTGGSNTIEWQYDPANATNPIDTVYQFDGDATPENTFSVTPSNNVLTITGVTSFSDWFAGNAVAVPVTLSGFAIE
ncbi:MAG: beta strand repeat-containing protein [Candidatus Sumerlaeaceae bacterium]